MKLFNKVIVGSLLLYLGKKVTEAARFGGSIHYTDKYTATGNSNAVYSELHADSIFLDISAKLLVKDLKTNSIQLKLASKMVVEKFSPITEAQKVQQESNDSNRSEAQLTEASSCTVASNLNTCNIILKGASEFTVLGDLNNCKVTMDPGTKLIVNGKISHDTTIEWGEDIQFYTDKSNPNPVVYCDSFDEEFSKDGKVQFALTSQNLNQQCPIDLNYIVYSGLPNLWKHSVSKLSYCLESAKQYKDKIDPEPLQAYVSYFRTLPLINRCFRAQENQQSL